MDLGSQPRFARHRLDGFTPAMRACYDAKGDAGMMSVLIQLIEQGLTVGDLNRSLVSHARRVPIGWTPLHMMCDGRCENTAAEKMRPWCVRLLLHGRADPMVLWVVVIVSGSSCTRY